MARWLRLLLMVVPVGFAVGGCGVDRSPLIAETTGAAAAAPASPTSSSDPPAAVPPRKVIPGPDVTVLPDGSAVLAPRVGDVAMLRRMPDGTFKRVCGPPEPDMRDMIQAKMRARRGAK